MIAAGPSMQEAGSLLVFSDDWGRHPSSCQHLIRCLLDRIPVTWVNTIGTRAPRFDLATLRRVGEKVGQWKMPSRKDAAGPRMASDRHPNLTTVNPKMWPWFSSPRDRRLNRWLLQRQLAPLIEQMPQPVVGLTTLPITADLPEVLAVERWVYYCVDDFSQWPGLDGRTLRRMDVEMIRDADALIAVSETLQSMIGAEGRTADLLTHGVDVEFWANPNDRWTPYTEPCPLAGLTGPCVVFWGVIDRRMDSGSLVRLSRDLQQGTIVLIGPQQDPDPAVLALPNLKTLSPMSLNVLPRVAARADVLVMPYADLPVTRAMQPLKLKEYLATGKPVVVNRLPSTESWSDCLDTADTPEEFSRLVRERMLSGIPVQQQFARSRLKQESWQSKAEQLLQVVNEHSCPQNPSARSGGVR